MFEEEQAKVMTEQEQERMNLETALELQRKLDAREEVPAEATQAHEIDWNDHFVLRYHAQLNRPYSIAEVRKNMIMYLKNQGGYKMSYFKGMKYEDIRPIFEQVWDQTQSFMPMDSEKESKEKAEERMKRKTSKAREDKIKRQKTKDDPEKLTLMEYVKVVSDSEEAINVIPLAVKSPIVSWKSYCKGDMGFYEIHRADSNYKTYKFFSEMLNDFDRDDLIVLYKLFNEKYAFHKTRDTLTRMLRWKLHVNYEIPEMAYELLKFIRGGLLGIKGLLQVYTAGRTYTATTNMLVSLDLSRLATTLNRLEKSEDAEDEGPTTEDEDPAAGDEGLAAGDEGPGMRVESLSLGGDEAVPEGQQRAAPVVETAVGEPLGLGYGALRCQEIALGEGQMPNVFEVDQSSISVPEHERPERVSALRQPTLTTWIDLEDGIAYIDVPAYPPPAPPVQTPPFPEWSSGSLPVSPAPSIFPSPVSSPMIPLTVPSPVASPATAEIEGFLTELGARVEMQGGLIHDHMSLEHEQERVVVTFGAIWRPVLALESWASQMDAQRAAL
ncbi:hypothetical protein Tco_0671063 [Tanacetum coccineum]